MYTLIESRGEIAKAQDALEATIRQNFKTRVVKDIGWQGGRRKHQTLNVQSGYWFYSADHKEGDNPKRLNWFGKHGDGPGVQIAVEVNVPYAGRNDMLAGFFARHNQTGRVYLFHTGRVGGGAKGVSKDAFLAWSALTPAIVQDANGDQRNGIVVMPIEGKGATRSAIDYVQSIIDFKQAVRDGETITPETKERERLLKAYYEESSGRRKGKIKARDIDYVSRHGEVVNALSAWRTASGLVPGEKLVKNVLIDLGLKKAGGLIEVYEVKTSSSRGDVYMAIGQLTVHSPSESCRRIMVLPADDALKADLAAALQRNGIELIRYRLSETDARILG
ncbi:hypothetical protein [Variovorax sp. OV700]|uniref:hypothetical protein n=1 Tax=Variovorax sp. OV700 TaxID=1882826 RepID=UPI00088F2EF9|nr:hypothetical protein [Variovorax sp. OV700]SDI18739.1 hypothetical protein SAMN05444748_10467 [Variovorax sp. OV700]